MKLCLRSAVVEGLVAICDRPEGHEPATLHYDVELDRAWSALGFEGPTRAVLGEAGRREAEDGYWQGRRGADEIEMGTEMTG